MAMGQNPVPPVNIPIPTEITSQFPLKSTKMGGAPTPKWDPIGFEPQPYKPRMPGAKHPATLPQHLAEIRRWHGRNHLGEMKIRQRPEGTEFWW